MRPLLPLLASIPLLAAAPATGQRTTTGSPPVPTASPSLPTASPSLPTASPAIPTASPRIPTDTPELPGSPEVTTRTPSIASPRALLRRDRPRPPRNVVRFPRRSVRATREAFRRMGAALRELDVPASRLQDIDAFVRGAPRTFEEAFDPLGDIRDVLPLLRDDDVPTARIRAQVSALTLGMRKLVRLNQAESTPSMERRRADLRARLLPLAEALARELGERAEEEL